MDWNLRVLQDLVYVRVRGCVDLLDLVDLERDLAESIEQALGPEDGPAVWTEAGRASRGLLDQAWRRLEEEWRQLRDMKCPLCLCSGPNESQAPVD